MKLDRYTQKAQETILAAQQLAAGAKSPVLDVEHRAVREAAAPHGTRVRYLWVQAPDSPSSGSLPGETPEDYSKSHPGAPDFSGLDYGRIYDAAAIDAAKGRQS